MNIITKVILTNEDIIAEKIILNLNLEENIELKNYKVYSWIKEEENITLVKYNIWSEKEVIKYLNENHEITKVLVIWYANILNDLELKFWDIIIPNAFINEENKSVFLEYAVWENYDLNKFWLVMNWICLTIKDIEIYNWETQEILEKFSPDIIDNDSFYILEELNEKNLIEKTVSIKMIKSNSDDENIDFTNNLVNIWELVL